MPIVHFIVAKTETAPEKTLFEIEQNTLTLPRIGEKTEIMKKLYEVKDVVHHIERTGFLGKGNHISVYMKE